MVGTDDGRPPTGGVIRVYTAIELISFFIIICLWDKIIIFAYHLLVVHNAVRFDHWATETVEHDNRN